MTSCPESLHVKAMSKLPSRCRHFTVSNASKQWTIFNTIALYDSLRQKTLFLSAHALPIKLRWIYRHLGDTREKDIPEVKTQQTGDSSSPVLQMEVLFSMRNWFQYRMMMSLISNYVFTEILQSLLVCLLFPVIHRCLTLCVCVCACVTERDVIHLTYVRLKWGIHPPPFMGFW